MAALIRPGSNDFPERILLFAGGGAGKTEACLQVARHTLGHMHVYENDISFAWDRALATEFRDVDAAGKVTLNKATDDWANTLLIVREMVETASEAEDDWLVLDSMTPTWEQCRSWYLQQVHGNDLGAYMIKLRAQYGDDMQGYNKAMSESVNYDIVNKEYNRLYNLLFTWRGNLLVTAEAQALGGREGPEESMIFGHLGFKPSGQKRLHHIASTNIMLAHKTRDAWVMNVAKDRNREDKWDDNVPVDDFALNYLVGIAGWRPVKKGAQ